MALVAALGAGTAMFVASPSAPAHAASVHAAPAAHTVSFTVHAHAAPSGRLSSFANPLDITCNFDVGSPFTSGTNHSNSTVTGTSTTKCTYDINGSPADVPNIRLSADLLFNNAIVAHVGPTDHPDIDFATMSATSAPCHVGDYTNRATLLVTFPSGYVPQQESASGFFTETIDLCPGDGVQVPNVIGLSLSQATSALEGAGLVRGDLLFKASCDFNENEVSLQSPHPRTLVFLGTTANLTISTGPPASPPCP